MDPLDSMLKRMAKGSTIEAILLKDAEIQDALDQRDQDSFSKYWMAAFREVERLKKATGIQGDADARVGELRELAYLQSFNRWKSSDLAACISDDFGLIGDALVVGCGSPWLKRFVDAYAAGQFPCTASGRSRSNK